MLYKYLIIIIIIVHYNSNSYHFKPHLQLFELIKVIFCLFCVQNMPVMGMSWAQILKFYLIYNVLLPECSLEIISYKNNYIILFMQLKRVIPLASILFTIKTNKKPFIISVCQISNIHHHQCMSDKHYTSSS